MWHGIDSTYPTYSIYFDFPLSDQLGRVGEEAKDTVRGRGASGAVKKWNLGMRGE